MTKKGAIIISLDFELNWGVHDVFSIDQYEENLLGARKAVVEMLDLFQRFDIQATWATVGMLYYDNKEALLKELPTMLPSYTKQKFSPYEKLNDIGENEAQDPFHFGRSLLNKIRQYPGQEIASHTFSHYYCLEDGQTAEQFEADLLASIKVNKEFGYEVKSLVFPRNQLNSAYLDICKKHGIESYRGNEKSWIYKESKFHREGLLKKVVRFVDSYVNLTGHNTYCLHDISKEPIVNLPSSQFLRPYDEKLKRFERLRLRRIKKGMIHAAKNSEVYHLWWHPHNFGKDIEVNMLFLKEILELVVALDEKYGFESLTMKDAATRAYSMKKYEEKQYKKTRIQSQYDM